VRTGSSENQIGLVDQLWGEGPRTERGGIPAIRDQLCGCPLVHGRPDQSPSAGTVHEDPLVGPNPVLIKLPLEESLDEG